VWPGRELGAHAAAAGGIAAGAWRLGVEGEGTAPAEIVALGGERTQAEAGIGLRVGWAPGGAIPGIDLGPTWVHTWFDEAGVAVADEGFPTVDIGVRWEVPVGPVALVVGAAGAYVLAPTVVRIGADGADVSLSPLRARLAAGVAWPR